MATQTLKIDRNNTPATDKKFKPAGSPHIIKDIK